MAKNKEEKIPVRVEGTIIRLPQKPFDEDYEDFIAAYLISAGYHTETQLIKRESERTVMEIDIISSDNNGNKRWFEIKSAGWSIGDLYEMAGKKVYCDVHPAFVYKNEQDKYDVAPIVAEKLGIELINDEKGNLEELQKKYPHLYNDANEWVIDYVRLALFIERCMAWEISENRKSHKGQEAYEALSYFWRYVKQYSYFEGDAATRGRKLIDTFDKYRNLTARMARMSEDGTMPAESDAIPYDVFKRITYNCKQPDILYGAQLAELTCRLKILRSVVDHIVNDDKELKADVSLWIQRLPNAILNGKLHGGIHELRQHPYVKHYPHFWQVFIYVFGGFIVEDRKDEEFRIMSQLTGIPIEYIADALRAFEILFPTPGGWFVKDVYSNINHLKHVPASLRAPGVFARQNIFCVSKNIEFKAFYQNVYARKDMEKWLWLSFEYIKTRAEIVTP